MGHHDRRAADEAPVDPGAVVMSLLPLLRTRAEAASWDLPDLSAALDLLRKAGILRAVLPAPEGTGLGWAPGGACGLSDLLRRVGAADLSLARLLEGHVNAAVLVETHGERPARDAMRAAVRDSALLGVWGADGAEPLVWTDRVEGGVRLTGGKRFASGLGHVGLALVTACAAPGAPQRLFLVPADDPARHDYNAWTASAMRATRSGAFDATGLVVGDEGIVGPAGALTIEPWFEGGVWRYCAAHVGGAEGLIERWTDLLRRMDRLDDPVQRDRLGRAMAEAVATRAAVEAAAEAIDAAVEAPPDAVERAVAHGLMVREAVEGACARIIALCERSLGMAAHDARGPVDAMRRDLSLFLRQAAPDAKLDGALRFAEGAGPGGLR